MPLGRRRMGRPGLVGTVARTAVIAGTASAVAGGVNHRQQQKYANQDAQAQAEAQQQYEAQQYEAQQAAQQAAQQPQYPPPAAPEPAAGLGDDMIEQLKQLAGLHEQGILTDDEFAAQKAKILGT